MYLEIVSARWTRALDMSKPEEEPEGSRSISFSLKRSSGTTGRWMRLASGDDLLGWGKPKWDIDLNMSEIEKDAPWKGLVWVFPKSERPEDKDENRLLGIALRVTAEEMNECWGALMQGVVPEYLEIDLREKPPQIGRSKTDKFEKEWNDIEHKDVEIRRASFRYKARTEPVVAEPKTHPLVRPAQYIVALLVAILVVLILKR